MAQHLDKIHSSIRSIHTHCVMLARQNRTWFGPHPSLQRTSGFTAAEDQKWSALRAVPAAPCLGFNLVKRDRAARVAGGTILIYIYIYSPHKGP